MFSALLRIISEAAPVESVPIELISIKLFSTYIFLVALTESPVIWLDIDMCNFKY